MGLIRKLASLCPLFSFEGTKKRLKWNTLGCKTVQKCKVKTMAGKDAPLSSGLQRVNRSDPMGFEGQLCLEGL